MNDTLNMNDEQTAGHSQHTPMCAKCLMVDLTAQDL